MFAQVSNSKIIVKCFGRILSRNIRFTLISKSHFESVELSFKNFSHKIISSSFKRPNCLPNQAWFLSVLNNSNRVICSILSQFNGIFERNPINEICATNALPPARKNDFIVFDRFELFRVLRGVCAIFERLFTAQNLTQQFQFNTSNQGDCAI